MVDVAHVQGGGSTLIPGTGELYFRLTRDFRNIYRLGGLVVKASASRAEDPGYFCGSSLTSDFKIDTPVATLPDAWRYRVSAGTGRPGVSIL